MEEYGRAKTLLFQMLPKEGIAIVNGDDPFTSKLLQGCTARVMSYGLGSADLTAHSLKCGKKGVVFVACYQGEEYPFKDPLIGKFNVYNLLAVIAAGLAQGMTLEQMAGWLRLLPPIPGRMTPVKNSLGLTIFVDYAHTPDALKNGLETLRETCGGRLITLFGCGGERDSGKRAEMGSIAEKFSDLVVVTSDNPRHEDPQSIADQILSGCKESHKVELDRRKAIEYAIENCQPSDIIFIAGKGHETVQITGSVVHPFDDVQVAQELCQVGVKG
jgi:UDP-N-acetylmuramoyl-L-alanyl-D-glutamate--2,6-diaminopimelate ligase